MICHEKSTSSPEVLLKDGKYEFLEDKNMPMIQLFR